MKILKAIVKHIRENLEGVNEFINEFAKGMITGNVISSNGGGIYVDLA